MPITRSQVRRLQSTDQQVSSGEPRPVAVSSIDSSEGTTPRRLDSRHRDKIARRVSLANDPTVLTPSDLLNTMIVSMDSVHLQDHKLTYETPAKQVFPLYDPKLSLPPRMDSSNTLVSMMRQSPVPATAPSENMLGDLMSPSKLRHPKSAYLQHDSSNRAVHFPHLKSGIGLTQQMTATPPPVRPDVSPSARNDGTQENGDEWEPLRLGIRRCTSSQLRTTITAGEDHEQPSPPKRFPAVRSTPTPMKMVSTPLGKSPVILTTPEPTTQFISSPPKRVSVDLSTPTVMEQIGSTPPPVEQPEAPRPVTADNSFNQPADKFDCSHEIWHDADFTSTEAPIEFVLVPPRTPSRAGSYRRPSRRGIRELQETDVQDFMRHVISSPSRKRAADERSNVKGPTLQPRISLSHAEKRGNFESPKERSKGPRITCYYFGSPKPLQHTLSPTPIREQSKIHETPTEPHLTPPTIVRTEIDQLVLQDDAILEDLSFDIDCPEGLQLPTTSMFVSTPSPPALRRSPARCHKRLKSNNHLEGMMDVTADDAWSLDLTKSFQ